MTQSNIPERFKVPYTWMDGSIVDTAESEISVMTLTLHYGLGAFEGIRAYDGAKGPAVFRLQEHMKRLHRSTRLLRMEMPYTVDELCAAAVETLSKNGLKEAYLRPIAFVDDGERGLAARNNRTRVAIIVWPWGAYLGEEGLNQGITTMISGWTRMNSRSFMPKGKICGQYVNSIMAKRDAIMAGYHEAILLDDAGYVAEGSGENIFLVKKNVLYTPPLSAPILEGITRATIIQLAQESDIEVIERMLTRSDLFDADEVFFTGTAAEVTPVRAIDGRLVGQGARGPLTQQLQSQYFDVIRAKVPEHHDWLSPYSIA